MSSGGQLYPMDSMVPIPATECANWYAVHTRSRHEKVVENRLQGQGITTFLPLVREVHRWRDRRKTVELPLFSSYVFVKLAMTAQERARVFRVDGILGFVGIRGEGTPIPNEEIETVQALLSHKVPSTPHQFLKVGQRVRIRGGALDGLEGIFLSTNAEDKVVVSVNVIQRSLAVRIEGYEIEPL